MSLLFLMFFFKYWKTILKPIVEIAKFYAYSSVGMSFGCVGSYKLFWGIISHPKRANYWMNQNHHRNNSDWNVVIRLYLHVHRPISLQGDQPFDASPCLVSRLALTF